MSTSSAKSSPRKGGKESAGAFNEFWEAPDRFWRYRVRELEESEIDAISVSGVVLLVGLVLTRYMCISERWCDIVLKI